MMFQMALYTKRLNYCRKRRRFYGSIEWDGRYRSWYFFDCGETRWSFQHMKKIADFMKKLKKH